MQIDLLIDELNEYTKEKIQFFDECVKIRSVHHLKKLKKKGALDKAIGLEKNVLKAKKNIYQKLKKPYKEELILLT